ncbi:hypothetical protein WR25_09242 [Diploscapter pachys]|uniref:alpha-1,2-Mannosidase n=1 Tax=Diploscapter pachys TaxID=2018661 RepID=A0A2A2KZA7_9BILA|nr:hypothetical protein WR25_09242 [Diploscapter pachys]
MGNTTEFSRAAKLVLESVRTDANVNVSVFETNIRVVGGLISAHMLLSRVPGEKLDPNWPCSGPLLQLAQDMADRLLPAFNTKTGMPFGTVNLRYGVHRGETPVTCTAGVGTFVVEFGSLSRLTGNPEYERLALRALDALWATRSPIGLVGNHINVNTGQWTAVDAGIGAGIDSYFEYLVKGAYLFQRPHLMAQFNKYVHAVNTHVRKEDWFYWVNMHKASTTMPVYQSLEAFWPGLLTMVGDVEDAARIMLQYSHVIRQFGFPPEFFNVQNLETIDKRAAFPLRPEMAESLMYLYRATEDPIFLQLGAQMVDAIEHSARTPCGYATVNNVNDHSQEDRMESFFLAETTKYLYLLFDPENFIHNDGSQYKTIETKHGECVYESGGYIFNTEAHPVDPGIIRCCSTAKKEHDLLKKWEDNLDISDIFGPKMKNYKLQVDEKLQGQLKEDEKKFVEKHDFGREDIEFEIDPEFKKQADELKRQKELKMVEFTKKNGSKSGKRGRKRPKKLNPSKERKTKKVKIEIEGKVDEARKLEPFEKLFQQAAKIDKDHQDQGKPSKIFEQVQQIVGSIVQEITPSIYEKLAQMNEELLASVVVKRSVVEAISVVYARCKNCCHLLDQVGFSVAYRIMQHYLHQNYFYPKRQISFVRSPACFLEDEPRIEDHYLNIKPEIDISQLAEDDAIHEEAFHFLPTFSPGSFEFSDVSHLAFRLLLAPPRPFETRFLGDRLVNHRRTNYGLFYPIINATTEIKGSGVSTYTTRTHTCGELRKKNIGERVKVVGWLARRRMDKFIVLRDAYGLVQARVPDDFKFGESSIKDLPYETVLEVEGQVTGRGKDANSQMETGEIEIEIDKLRILNKAIKLPMRPNLNASNQTRMKYRYVDLRSDYMQRALRLRSQVVHSMRKFLVEQRKFVDVETPTLFRRTPGGAAEFLVPAPPPNQGLCYSLPQSPQQFKQLLMVGGIDRYFQIARCYRDELSKGDRQLEFTQVDLELSFTTQEGVMKLVEELIYHSWPEESMDLRPQIPFPKLSFKEAMSKYGSDKPDMRFDWHIQDCELLVEPLRALDPAAENSSNFTVKLMVCRGAADSVNGPNIKEWKRLTENHSLVAPFTVYAGTKKNWMKGVDAANVKSLFEIAAEDAIILSWGNEENVTWTLGQLRNYVAETKGIRMKREVTAHWIVDFPLFTKEDGKLASTHHPFTAPVNEHLSYLDSSDISVWNSITGQHYDLVMNGVELGGGSIRIHNSDLQRRVLDILGEPTEQLEHLLQALESGAPPHGGFALGLDRFISMLVGHGNPLVPVREVIAFPKSKEGRDLMCDAPAEPDEAQLGRYAIKFTKTNEAEDIAKEVVETLT